MTGNYDMSADRLIEALAAQERVLELGGPQDHDPAYDLIRAVTAGQRIRITQDGRLVALVVPASQDGGPDLMRAVVYGDSYPDLIEAAKAEARGFYGPDAPLAVEFVGVIWNSMGGSRRGAYNTTVTVRCTRLPDGWDVP